MLDTFGCTACLFVARSRMVCSGLQVQYVMLVIFAQVQIEKVMRRERLEVNPVFSTAFAHTGPMGQQTTTGYIRLVSGHQPGSIPHCTVDPSLRHSTGLDSRTHFHVLQVNFNMHAADDVQKAIRQLRVGTIVGSLQNSNEQLLSQRLTNCSCKKCEITQEE